MVRFTVKKHDASKLKKLACGLEKYDSYPYLVFEARGDHVVFEAIRVVERVNVIIDAERCVCGALDIPLMWFIDALDMAGDGDITIDVNFMDMVVSGKKTTTVPCYPPKYGVSIITHGNSLPAVVKKRDLEKAMRDASSILEDDGSFMFRYGVLLEFEHNRLRAACSAGGMVAFGEATCVSNERFTAIVSARALLRSLCLFGDDDNISVSSDEKNLYLYCGGTRVSTYASDGFFEFDYTAYNYIKRRGYVRSRG